MTDQLPTVVTVSEYAAMIERDRKSARQRLDRMVRQGTATREVVKEYRSSTRWGKPCAVAMTLALYTLAPGAK